MTEPPVKIVMLRVTNDHDDLSMEDFTEALRSLLGEEEWVKNANVMLQSFLVDGKQVQKDSWFVEQERKEDLTALDPEEMQSRLTEMGERIDAATAGKLDREEVAPEISRYAFLLKKFAEGVEDVRLRDRALTLRATAMAWLVPAEATP